MKNSFKKSEATFAFYILQLHTVQTIRNAQAGLGNESLIDKINTALL